MSKSAHAITPGQRLKEAEAGEVFEGSAMLKALDPKALVQAVVTKKSPAGIATIDVSFMGIRMVQVAGKPDGAKVLWTEVSR